MRANQMGQGIILVILAATLWGVSGTFSQFLFQEKNISVEWLMSVRMLVSGFILTIVSKARTNSDTFAPWTNRRDTIQLLVFGFLGMLTVQYTYFAAIKHSNAATATVLQFISPVLIAIYLIIKERKPLERKMWIAIGLALLGTFLLVTHGNVHGLAMSGTAFFFGIASAVSLAIYTVLPESLLKKYHPTTIIGWGLLIGGVGISLVKAPWHIEGIWDTSTYIYTVFIIFLGTLVPFYTYLSGVKLIGGQKASLLTSAEPLSAAVLSVTWLGISFQPVDYLGSLLIVFTVFLLARNKPNRLNQSA